MRIRSIACEVTGYVRNQVYQTVEVFTALDASET
jgi:hypothetical protein